MPCYHFRIKSDKKPSGLRVAAGEHVSYVYREGKYRDIDSKQLMGSRGVYQNVITGESPILPLPKKPILLYSSPFGKITLDEGGVHVSRNASIDTVAIALATAQRIFGDEVRINGTATFEGQALFATNEFELGAHFSNIDLEIQREGDERERGYIEFGRKILEGYAGSSGGRTDGGDGRGDAGSVGASPRGNGGKSRIEALRFANRALKIKKASIHDIAEHTREVYRPGLRVSVLPSIRVAPKRRGSRVLLQSHAGRELLDRRRGQRPDLFLRRSVSRKRAELVNASADSILKILQQRSSGDFAFSHLQYINRDALYAERGGCAMTGEHLPAWAGGSSLRFFHTADRFERANGERYKEIVFSLPNELTTEQGKEILDRFIAKHLKNHYYAWAIHEKIGTMSAGERHPHVHIMFSTRELDEVERREERDPARFFSRANKKFPERGGCAKSDKWRGADRAKTLLELRRDYAEITNEVLEKYGITAKVSERSLKDQRDMAILRGDHVLAQMLDRVPETHVNPTSIVRDDEVVRQQKQLRKYNDSRLDRILRRELASDAKKEEEITELYEKILPQTQNLLLQEWDPRLPEDVQKKLEKARTDLRNDYRYVLHCKGTFLWGRESLEEAKKEQLGEDGREAWDLVMQLRMDLREQKRLWMEIETAYDASIDELVARDEIEAALNDRIADLEEAYKKAAKELQPHLKKLSDRSAKKKLAYRVSDLLYHNKLPKRRYVHAIEDMAASCEAYRRILDDARAQSYLETDPEKLRDEVSMTLKEARRLLEAAKYYKSIDVRTKAEELEAAKKYVYSYERIIMMAEDVWSKGETSALRKEGRSLRKKREQYEKDWASYVEAQNIFDTKPPAEEERRNRDRAELYEWRLSLSRRRASLESEEASLQERQEKMDAVRDTIEAEDKIGRIALGILKKNRRDLLKVKRLSGELKALEEEKRKLGRERRGVEIEMKQKGDGRYQIIRSSSKRGSGPNGPTPPGGSSHKAAAGGSYGGGGGGGGRPSCFDDARTIGAALAMQHGALIAKEEKDNTLTENWDLVSNLEKDELIEEASHGR